MTNQYALAKFTGFTEREVRQLCERYHMAIPHKDCATDASSNFSSDETKSGVNT